MSTRDPHDIEGGEPYRMSRLERMGLEEFLWLFPGTLACVVVSAALEVQILEVRSDTLNDLVEKRNSPRSELRC